MDDRNDYNSNNNMNNDNNNNRISTRNIFDNVPESSPRSNASSISILLGNENNSDDRKISPEKAKANKASTTAFFLTETLDNDDSTIDNDDKYRKKMKNNVHTNNDRRSRVAWQDPKKIDYAAPKKIDRSKGVHAKRPIISSNTGNGSQKISSSGYGYKPKTTLKPNYNNNRKVKNNTSIHDSVLNMSNNSKFNTNANRKTNTNNSNGLSRVKSTVTLLPGGRVKKMSAGSGNFLSSGNRSSRSAPTLPTSNKLQGLERIPEVARKETIMRSLSGKPKTNTNSNMNMKINNNNINKSNINSNSNNNNNNTTNNGKIKITNNEILKWKQSGNKKKIDINNTNESFVDNDNTNHARSIATNTTLVKKLVPQKDTIEILATLDKIEKIDSLRNHKENIKYITNSKNKDSDISQLMAKVSKIGSKLTDAMNHAAKYKDLTDTYFND